MKKPLFVVQVCSKIIISRILKQFSRFFFKTFNPHNIERAHKLNFFVTQSQYSGIETFWKENNPVIFPCQLVFREPVGLILKGSRDFGIKFDPMTLISYGLF